MIVSEQSRSQQDFIALNGFEGRNYENWRTFRVTM